MELGIYLKTIGQGLLQRWYNTVIIDKILTAGVMRLDQDL